MNLAGCFKATYMYMLKDQSKLDFSCHDPFKRIAISASSAIERVCVRVSV